MVIKSLTITEEAYNTLSRLKRTDESFSKTIIRVGKPSSGHLSKYLGILKGSGKSAEEMISEVKKNRMKATKEMEDRQKRFGKW